MITLRALPSLAICKSCVKKINVAKAGRKVYKVIIYPLAKAERQYQHNLTNYPVLILVSKNLVPVKTI